MNSTFLPSQNQWIKIRSLLGYVANKVPFYKDLFKTSGLRFELIQEPEDFKHLPIVNKSIIQQKWDRFVSDDFRQTNEDKTKWFVESTSGTTGTPLKIVHSRSDELLAGRALMKARIESGLTLPARWAFLTGGLHFLDRDDQAIDVRGTRGTNDLLALSALNMTEPVLRHHIEAIEEFQPTWIYSLPGVLLTLGNYVLSTRNKPLELHNLQLIEIVAEYASDETKNLIAKVFGRMPVSIYGCREIWGIAFDCSRGNLHVMQDNAYLEVIRQDGSPAELGEEGDVVITGLNFRAMPFIRYKLGDRAIMLEEKCECTSSYPSIKIKEGRITDFILGHPGLVGNQVFDTIIRFMQNNTLVSFRQFRVVQRSVDRFDVWIASESEWDDELKEVFKRKARSILGGGTEFLFKFVDAIPLHSSGKSRSFIVDTESDTK